MTLRLLLEPILLDPDVTEVMINGHQRVMVEKHGTLIDVPSPYDNEAQLLQDISTIFLPLGLTPNESHPLLDGRLEDGSRVNVVMPPIALNGPSLTIRKFIFTQPTVDDLIHKYDTLTQQMIDFLHACVLGRLNIGISGGTGSGKSTLANVLFSMIPDDERIVLAENAHELLVPKPRVVVLESRPANLEGKGEITLRDLVRNAMKMRPDRIIVGEVHGSEIFDLIQAMNTGHDGAIFTMHAISPRDALPRLEIMMSEGSPSMSILGIRENIATALDLIVQISRLPSGTRRITNITEITGMTGDVITMQDIFVWEQTGFDDGRENGRFKATGVIPHFIKRFHEMGIKLPLTMFTPD